MGWVKVSRNTRYNGKRYLKDAVVEMDDATAKASENFVPCAAPTAPAKKPVPAPSAPTADKSKS